MGSSIFITTPSKTPSNKSVSSANSRKQQESNSMHSLSDRSNSDFKSRFEAYNRLEAAAVAFGEKLTIPEIVALGGQSDGKSSLLEALLGFRFNVRDVEMGTRRPLILQMVHDPSALEPRCRFQMTVKNRRRIPKNVGVLTVLGTAIADIIRSRSESLLKKTKTTVSSKPIAKKGEPENTPDQILSMVKSLASPPHRLLLFLQASAE